MSVPFMVYATNSCNPQDLSVMTDLPSPYCFGLGTTWVHATAVGGGESLECSFPVTVLGDCSPTHAPTLSVQFPSISVIQFLWPDPGSNYVVQSTASLARPVQWQDLALPYEGGNGFRSLSLTNPPQGAQFFRLRLGNLPRYNVLGPAVTSIQFNTLASSLGLPAQAYQSNSFVLYTDDSAFLQVPTLNLGKLNTQDEEGTDLVGEEFLFDKINQMTVFDDQTAQQTTAQALQSAGLLPAPYDAVPEVVHTHFTAVDSNITTVSDRNIDTKVRYRFTLGGYPVVGPGAKASVVFGSTGNVTHANYTLRPVAQEAPMSLLPQSVADDLVLGAYQSGFGQSTGTWTLASQIVYYAPPAELSSVQTLIPYYQYEASFMPTGMVNPILMRSVLIPAVTGSKLVPVVHLSVSTVSNNVTAQASVNDGQAPYTYTWNSSSAIISASNSATFSYSAQSRSNETVTLLVTDANGLCVGASSNVFVGQSFVAPRQSAATTLKPRPHVAGTTDVGTEWIGVTAGLTAAPANAGGFVSRFQSDGSAVVRFNWGEYNAWERDFHDSALGGDDNNWVDNVDAVFYTGHANSDGWVFTSTVDHTFVDYTATRYGQQDLEWLVIAACGPLQPGTPPHAWYQRWGPAFQRLHLLCGYDNISSDTDLEGHKWADYMLRGLTVARAWILAGSESQSRSGLNVCVMTAYDASGICNMSDHFWGKGSVGPDIYFPAGFVLYQSPVD
ncbi:MAG TPA: DUF6345 domain-containing protein [Candidatus Acidoferrum sp.]|nr:DUF6345 domain-containing protein [Candidatus Acidoferrum sp.]